MVTASVLALEEPAPDWIRRPTRRDLHESFDLWLDALEDAVKEEPTSLDALTRGVLARRQELTAQVTEFLVAKRHAQTLEQKSALAPSVAASCRPEGWSPGRWRPWWGR